MAWGALLLVRPQALGRLPGARIDRPALIAARLLGARDLVQAIALSRTAQPRWLLAGAAVDGVHATSMAALAALSPSRRSLAGASALLACSFAVSEGRRARALQTYGPAAGRRSS